MTIDFLAVFTAMVGFIAGWFFAVKTGGIFAREAFKHWEKEIQDKAIEEYKEKVNNTFLEGKENNA